MKMSKDAQCFGGPVPHYLDDPDDPEFLVFHYHWKHLITGVTGDRAVWTRNRLHFLEILTYWNRDKDWKYWE